MMNYSTPTGPSMFLNHNHTSTSNHFANRAATEDPLKYVSHSFLNGTNAPSSSWNNNTNGAPSRQQPKVKENPFAPDEDSQIEAHLQALGGQMAGSILDF